MAPERRRLALLVSLLVVILAIAAYQFWPAASAGAMVAATGRSGSRAPTTPALTVPEVHLTALGEPKPSPGLDAPRDLFRFKSRTRPAPPVVATPVVVEMPEAPSGPPPPPPIPPIALRFIGLVEATERSRKIAILSDARGIYQGREGDIIEGRYRILRIGVESVEMAYVNGTGRQTIRLSGS
jgi:hypothetical protein